MAVAPYALRLQSSAAPHAHAAQTTHTATRPIYVRASARKPFNQMVPAPSAHQILLMHRTPAARATTPTSTISIPTTHAHVSKPARQSFRMGLAQHATPTRRSSTGTAHAPTATSPSSTPTTHARAHSNIR